MKQTPTPLVDEYLTSLHEIKQAELNPFFYTRLLAKIENKREHTEWNLPLNPVWIIGMLTLLLAVNALMFTSKSTRQKTGTSLSIEAFAESYDLTVTPTY
jgi:hypothetical protein